MTEAEVDKLRELVERLRKPIKWHYALSTGDQWQIDEDREEAAKQIEDMFLGALSTDEAAEAERQRCVELIEEVRVSPAWSGQQADWICGVITRSITGEE